MRWLLWSVLGSLVGLAGCEEPVDYCAVEGERANDCGQPIDVENCQLRTNRCRPDDGAVLVAYSDCLDAAGYGVCGPCIQEEIPRICTGDPAEEDLDAVMECLTTVRVELSNRCDDQLFVGCGSVTFPEGQAALLMPLGLWALVARRRREGDGAPPS